MTARIDRASTRRVVGVQLPPHRGELDWVERAACRGRPVDEFLTDSPWTGSCPSDPDRVPAALARCSGCPVVAECLDDAVRTWDAYAVRGGTTPADRVALVAAQRPLRRGRPPALARRPAPTSGDEAAS